MAAMAVMEEEGDTLAVVGGVMAAAEEEEAEAVKGFQRRVYDI
jgi:hypothetical protein